MIIDFIKLNERAKPPFRATDDSAGADLYACIDGDVVIKSHQQALVGTGIAAEIPQGYAGFVFARSSLASKHGVSLANAVGVIDADYRGELKVALINHSDNDYTIRQGERIAQLVVLPVALPTFTEKQHLTDTSRGVGGFGSTGLI
ncbi:MAG: dUTP diphosphatase [Oscillospiraceae bacterium]|nr:dUTP diphosphatase [Oscillospiraceae bacterium]